MGGHFLALDSDGAEPSCFAHGRTDIGRHEQRSSDGGWYLQSRAAWTGGPGDAPGSCECCTQPFSPRPKANSSGGYRSPGACGDLEIVSMSAPSRSPRTMGWDRGGPAYAISARGDMQRDRHRGRGYPRPPATPPDMRVRIRRFGGLSLSGTYSRGSSSSSK